MCRRRVVILVSRLLTEDRGALRRDLPKGTASCRGNVEEAAGLDPPKKALLALRGVGVDDGGGRGVGVDDGEGGDSRPSDTMTIEESTRIKSPRISQLARSYCLAVAPCPPLLPCCGVYVVAVSASLLPPAALLCFSHRVSYYSMMRTYTTCICCTVRFLRLLEKTRTSLKMKTK